MVVLIIVGLLLIVYQSDFLFKRNIISPAVSEVDEIDQKLSKTFNSAKTSKINEITDEACIELTAYLEVILESDLHSEAVMEGLEEHKFDKFKEIEEKWGTLEELEKKHGVDSESDYFLDHCAERIEQDNIREQIDQMKEEFRLKAE